MRKIIGLFILVLISCQTKREDLKKEPVVFIQPYKDFTDQEAQFIHKELKKVFANTVLGTKIHLPKDAYVKSRNRYRADSLIRKLRDSKKGDTISLGLTHFDISTSKNQFSDWGVMGLGYRPGKACVISTFRLNKKNKREQLVKVVLHELGHNLSLPHCSNQSCLMRDAEGGNPLDDEKDFCSKCKIVLKVKGMKAQ